MERTLYINNYQASLFPNDFIREDMLSVADQIKKSIPEFDGPSSVIPVPLDAARNITRIQLLSRDNTLRCNISFEKISLVWSNMDELPDFNITSQKRIEVIEKISNICHPNGTYKRVGWVTELFFETKDVSTILSEKILKSEIINGLESYKLNFSYPLTLSTFAKTNKVLSVGDGTKSTGNKDSVIIITNDINTHQKENVNWDILQVKTFFEEAEKHSQLDKIFSTFFT